MNERERESENITVKDGGLTKPMVDVISQVTADCLDPGGNIGKESRPAQIIW